MAEERGRVCRATNSRGQPCQAKPMKESDYCYLHNPDEDVRKKRAAAVRAGGARTAEKVAEKAKKMGVRLPLILPDNVDIKTSDDVRALLSEQITILRTAPCIDLTGRVKAIGYLLQITIQSITNTDIEKRLEALEGLNDDGAGLSQKKPGGY